MAVVKRRVQTPAQGMVTMPFSMTPIAGVVATVGRCILHSNSAVADTLSWVVRNWMDHFEWARFVDVAATANLRSVALVLQDSDPEFAQILIQSLLRF